MVITFDQLPEAVHQLSIKLDNIEKLLNLNYTSNLPEQDKWFDLNELCGYLPDKPAKATVYGWVHDSLIPSHKKSKKLSFLKSEIDSWLKSGRKETIAERTAKAESFLNTRTKKRR